MSRAAQPVPADAPERPRETRVVRGGALRGRVSGQAHERLPELAEVLLLAVLPAFPPTALALSGLNRTS